MHHPESQPAPAAKPQPQPQPQESETARATAEVGSARLYGQPLGISLGKAGYVVIAFTVFLLALLWGALAYQLSHDRTAVLDAARTNTHNLVRAYAEHVGGTLGLLDQTLLRIKDEYEKKPSGLGLAQSLRDASTKNAGALLLGIVDEHGDMVATSLPLPPASRFAGDREYFLTHARNDTGQLYISEPMVGRISGRHIVVALSRGLKKPDGTFGGVVFVSFDPQFLSGFFSDLVISKDTSFAIVGRDLIVRDIVRGSGHVPGAIGRSLANSPLVSALERSADGNSEAVGALDGVARIFSYRSLPDYPLIVVASFTEADVLVEFRERKSWLIGVATALSLIFVGVAVFQLHRLTLQWRSEQALRQTQELLVESQRVAKLGYVLYDVATDRVYWSDSMFVIRGVSRRDSFTLAEAAHFMTSEDRERYLALRKKAITERHAFAIDVRLPRSDGRLSWEHRVVHPHFDARGELTQILVVVQDITERKESEIELTRSRENMAQAQSIAALGSFERDLVTGDLEWSDEMYRVLGLEKGHALPSYDTVLALVHPDDRERFQAARDAGLNGIATGMLEFRIIRPDGDERIIHRENGVFFDENHRPIRVYGSYQDVTERRSAEERERDFERRLLHSQKLEALGTLAGGIAHDLNNTLTPIMALSKMTARRLEADSPLRANLDTIFSASEQARDLVKRVLAFSRRDEVDKKPTNLRDIVSEVLKLLRATIPTSIQLDARIGEVPLILADASQLHQVITNLVSNAAQAIGGGMGVITVTLDVVFDAASRGTIRLSVIDTGEGMDEATRRRIFEPFFTTKRVGQGTGLGLSIIERIVTDHGGRIEVESAPGKGARFDIYFPLPETDVSAAA